MTTARINEHNIFTVLAIGSLAFLVVLALGGLIFGSARFAGGVVAGGALAIAVADRVLMLENSIYSVISPEGCASIMWRDATKKDIAAQAMKITATDLQGLGLVDGIVPEPAGGAHMNHEEAAALLDKALTVELAELKKVSTDELVGSRYKKFRNMAQFYTAEAQ